MTAIKEPLALITAPRVFVTLAQSGRKRRWEVVDGQKRLGYELPNFFSS